MERKRSSISMVDDTDVLDEQLVLHESFERRRRLSSRSRAFVAGPRQLLWISSKSLRQAFMLVGDAAFITIDALGLRESWLRKVLCKQRSSRLFDFQGNDLDGNCDPNTTRTKGLLSVQRS